MTDHIVGPLKSLLEQLRQLLCALDDTAYTTPVAVLSHATIGHHMRHIIEFFLALERGYDSGVVNYDLRQRDPRLEADRTFALASLQDLAGRLDRADKALSLMTDFNAAAPGSYPVQTNYARELVYNLEHVVHHMALLRIGVQAETEVTLPEDFGVALSTMRHRKLAGLVNNDQAG